MKFKKFALVGATTALLAYPTVEFTPSVVDWTINAVAKTKIISPHAHQSNARDYMTNPLNGCLAIAALYLIAKKSSEGYNSLAGEFR